MTEPVDGSPRTSRGHDPEDGQGRYKAELPPLIRSYVLGHLVVAPLVIVWFAVFGPRWPIFLVAAGWVLSVLIVRETN